MLITFIIITASCHPHNVRPQVSDLPDLVEPEALGLNANAAVVRSSHFKMMIITTMMVMLTKLTTNQMSTMPFLQCSKQVRQERESKELLSGVLATQPQVKFSNF